MKYLYFALFEPEGTKYNISFPDLEGCLTCGDNLSDALHMAKDALEGWLVLAEDDKEQIPNPSKLNDITVSKGNFLVPIEVDTKLARIKFENKAVKKTLTIPYQLNELAELSGVNFSQILQKALKEHLHLD